MRSAALEELGRRGMPQEAIAWLKGGGVSDRPACIGARERPEGWRQYFQNIWARWD
jgi:hypothetical protein